MSGALVNRKQELLAKLMSVLNWLVTYHLMNDSNSCNKQASFAIIFAQGNKTFYFLINGGCPELITKAIGNGKLQLVLPMSVNVCREIGWLFSFVYIFGRVACQCC